MQKRHKKRNFNQSPDTTIVPVKFTLSAFVMFAEMGACTLSAQRVLPRLWGLYCLGRANAVPVFVLSFFGPSCWAVVLWEDTLSACGMLAGSEADIFLAMGCVFEAVLHLDGLKREQRR